ncbi:MAG: J domain-containing protein, partial [Mesorhizobium sp.]
MRGSLDRFAGDSGKKVANLVISSNVTLGVE